MFLFRHSLGLNILIIRHGESQANVDRSIYKRLPDRLVELTEKGIEQAKLTGKFITEKFNIRQDNTFLFSSSYKRAQQTTENINLSLNLNVRIDDRIIEHNHGLFEGLSKKERFKLFPNEAERFYAQKHLHNEFFTPTPMGESSLEVALRFRSFWKDVEDLIKNKHIDNIIIVAHGLTNLIIQKELMNYSVDWYAEQDEIPNCGVLYFKLHRNNDVIQDFNLIYTP